jgi:hypothetical protein
MPICMCFRSAAPKSITDMPRLAADEQRLSRSLRVDKTQRGTAGMGRRPNCADANIAIIEEILDEDCPTCYLIRCKVVGYGKGEVH